MRIEWNQKNVEIKIKGITNKTAKWGAGKIADDAKKNHTFKNVTGTLEKSIISRKSKFPEGGYIAIATAPHAHLVELGRHGIGAMPFMRPAAERNKNAIFEKFKQELTK